jgi:hypothetical protein
MTGTRIYQRTQIAWPTIAPLVIVGGGVVPLFWRTHLVVPMWIVAGAVVVSLLLFATLTVTVTSDGVEAAFGIGVVRKRLMFGDVVSFMPVRNTWLHGWGIHYFPGGVVWNASGLSAVEFKLTSGRLVRMGTAEPEAFAAAVAQATGKTESAHDAVSGGMWTARHMFGLVAGLVALVFAGWTIYEGFQPPAVTVGDTQFTVSNGLYRNTVSYSTIRSIELDSELPAIGMKTNGFAARNTLRGNFRVDTWGTARLYVNADVPPFVVVDTGERHIAINFADPMRTRGLYADLKSHIARNAKR